MYICHQNNYEQQNENYLSLSIINITATWQLSALSK